VYRRLAKFQEQLAQSLGTDVGGEMVAAARAAQHMGARIALIDLEAQALVNRVWSEMTFRERTRLIFGTIALRMPWSRGPSVEAELERYHKDPGTYLNEFA